MRTHCRSFRSREISARETRDIRTLLTTYYYLDVCSFSSSETKRRDPPKRPGSFGCAEPGNGGTAVRGHVADDPRQPEQDAAAPGRGYATHGPYRPGSLPETEIPVEASEFHTE
jgi:hypothetical protein